MQEFQYYPFVVKLDRCVGSSNTINDLSNKVGVPNKAKRLNVYLKNVYFTCFFINYNCIVDGY